MKFQLYSNNIPQLILLQKSIAEKSFSFEHKFNFSGHKYMSLENKNFLTNKKEIDLKIKRS